MIALIDGDILVYRAGFAAEKASYRMNFYNSEFGEESEMEFFTLKEIKEFAESNPEWEPVGVAVKEIVVEPVRNAIYSLKMMIDTIITNTQADGVRIFLTGSTNFRNDVKDPLKGYKANRKDARKPEHIEALRDYLVKHQGAVVTEGEEADDALGYTQADDTIICSIDKDLLMIPGRHYNITKAETTLVTENEGDLFFWQQMMTGDTVDNIPGLKGVGPKRAASVIEDCFGDLALVEEEVKKMYKAEFKEDYERRLNEMACFLWIRRHPNERKRIAA